MFHVSQKDEKTKQNFATIHINCHIIKKQRSNNKEETSSTCKSLSCEMNCLRTVKTAALLQFVFDRYTCGPEESQTPIFSHAQVPV